MVANAVAIPDRAQVSIPNRSFECGGIEFLSKVMTFHNEEDPMTKGGSYSTVCFDLEKRAEVIVYQKGQGLNGLGIDFDTLVSRYSEARVVDYGAVLDKTAAQKISRFRNVEALKVGAVVDIEEVIQVLQSLSHLKFFSGNFFNSELLRVALPGCEISSN